MYIKFPRTNIVYHNYTICAVGLTEIFFVFLTSSTKENNTYYIGVVH